MTESFKFLIIEDSLDDFDLLVRDLGKEFAPLQHRRVDTREGMILALNEPWDIILSDFSMPQFTGLKALEILKSSGKDIPFIIVSGTIGEEAAVEVMRAGASDYVLKTKKSRLMQAIRRELEAARGRAKGLTTEKALKDTEEQLRHMQKMEAVGQLAGGVAHDFNNMLSVVQIYCRKIKEFNIPEVNQYVDKILDVHNRSVSLTKQLLVFSRKQKGCTKTLLLNEILTGMQDMLQRLIGEPVELTLDTEVVPYKIKADPGQIEQVIMNLAVNARDAMPEGGHLRFKTGIENFSEPTLVGGETLSGNYATLEVSDNGTGMSKEILQRIFEPFFTTKSERNGTGLGLSIIYGIIHQNRGEIIATSELGKGTHFKIFLPENRELPVTEERPLTPASPQRGHETILLVEDNFELRELFRELLERKGYRVLEAANGLTALTMIESGNDDIRLVITDMVMPKMGGRDLSRRTNLKNKNIKFIYMSGYFEAALESSKASEDDFYFLQKPFSEDALLEKVRSVLDK